AGENRTMTLQLDPPELGRVEIKMSFEKNSKIKAVLTAEKPETHAMLQRDAGILERALQDAGLDSENGLSFELAKEGYTFGQDDHQGHGGGTKNRADADPEEEIIQTTLQWAVDEQTGHMRYNIVA
ncbi:MAG TPA: flagellar hook-length control protein FliK, partial [Alphaproteobacteria bacterium]|nr:flagellar hook-length control protein FliK [Alphaproteobacteria bacterium]